MFVPDIWRQKRLYTRFDPARRGKKQVYGATWMKGS
jgi:hypothetical protein